MCFNMVGAPGVEPGIGRLKVCCDTISPYSALVGRLTKSFVALTVRPRFAEQSQGNEAVTRLDDHLSFHTFLLGVRIVSYHYPDLLYMPTS